MQVKENGQGDMTVRILLCLRRYFAWLDEGPICWKYIAPLSLWLRIRILHRKWPVINLPYRSALQFRGQRARGVKLCTESQANLTPTRLSSGISASADQLFFFFFWLFSRRKNSLCTIFVVCTKGNEREWEKERKSATGSACNYRKWLHSRGPPLSLSLSYKRRRAGLEITFALSYRIIRKHFR